MKTVDRIIFCMLVGSSLAGLVSAVSLDRKLTRARAELAEAQQRLTSCREERAAWARSSAECATARDDEREIGFEVARVAADYSDRLVRCVETVNRFAGRTR